MPLRVITYNILAESYVRPEYYPFTPPAILAPARRRAALLERIVALDADVLCLQEVEQDAYQAIAARLPEYSGQYARKSASKPDGCATFWRGMPLLAQRTMRYADGTGHLALFVELAWEGRRLGIGNTHIKWQPPDAPQQTSVGLGQVSALFAGLDVNEAWIVCGDFNTIPTSPILQVALHQGWRDPYAGRAVCTCNSNGRAKRIDYVLHTASLQVRPRELPVIDGQTPLPSESQPSDHLPVGGEVDWSASPSGT